MLHPRNRFQGWPDEIQDRSCRVHPVPGHVSQGMLMQALNARVNRIQPVARCVACVHDSTYTLRAEFSA